MEGERAWHHHHHQQQQQHDDGEGVEVAQGAERGGGGGREGTEEDALYLLEVVVSNVKVDGSALHRPLQAPCLSIQLLDYPPLLLTATRQTQSDSTEHAAASDQRAAQKTLMQWQPSLSLRFSEGASALFKERPARFARALQAAPLYVMLLDAAAPQDAAQAQHRQPPKSSQKDHAFVHLAGATVDLRGWKNDTTRLHGYVPVIMHDVFGTKVAKTTLKLSVSFLGPEILRHLDPSSLLSPMTNTTSDALLRMHRDHVFHSSPRRTVTLAAGDGSPVRQMEPDTAHPHMLQHQDMMEPGSRDTSTAVAHSDRPSASKGPELAIYRLEQPPTTAAGKQLTRVSQVTSALSTRKHRAPHRTKTYPPPLSFQHTTAPTTATAAVAAASGHKPAASIASAARRTARLDAQATAPARAPNQHQHQQQHHHREEKGRSASRGSTQPALLLGPHGYSVVSSMSKAPIAREDKKNAESRVRPKGQTPQTQQRQDEVQAEEEEDDKKQQQQQREQDNVAPSTMTPAGSSAGLDALLPHMPLLQLLQAELHQLLQPTGATGGAFAHGQLANDGRRGAEQRMDKRPRSNRADTREKTAAAAAAAAARKTYEQRKERAEREEVDQGLLDNVRHTVRKSRVGRRRVQAHGGTGAENTGGALQRQQQQQHLRQEELDAEAHLGLGLQQEQADAGEENVQEENKSGEEEEAKAPGVGMERHARGKQRYRQPPEYTNGQRQSTAPVHAPPRHATAATNGSTPSTISSATTPSPASVVNDRYSPSASVLDLSWARRSLADTRAAMTAVTRYSGKPWAEEEEEEGVVGDEEDEEDVSNVQEMGARGGGRRVPRSRGNRYAKGGAGRVVSWEQSSLPYQERKRHPIGSSTTYDARLTDDKTLGDLLPWRRRRTEPITRPQPPSALVRLNKTQALREARGGPAQPQRDTFGAPHFNVERRPLHKPASRLEQRRESAVRMRQERAHAAAVATGRVKKEGRALGTTGTLPPNTAATRGRGDVVQRGAGAVQPGTTATGPTLNSWRSHRTMAVASRKGRQPTDELAKEEEEEIEQREEEGRQARRRRHQGSPARHEQEKGLAEQGPRAAVQESLLSLPDFDGSASLNAPLVTTADLAADPAFGALGRVQEGRQEQQGKVEPQAEGGAAASGAKGRSIERRQSEQRRPTTAEQEAAYAESFEASSEATGSRSEGERATEPNTSSSFESEESEGHHALAVAAGADDDTSSPRVSNTRHQVRRRPSLRRSGSTRAMPLSSSSSSASDGGGGGGGERGEGGAEAGDGFGWRRSSSLSRGAQRRRHSSRSSARSRDDDRGSAVSRGYGEEMRGGHHVVSRPSTADASQTAGDDILNRPTSATNAADFDRASMWEHMLGSQQEEQGGDEGKEKEEAGSGQYKDEDEEDEGDLQGSARAAPRPSASKRTLETEGPLESTIVADSLEPQQPATAAASTPTTAAPASKSSGLSILERIRLTRQSLNVSKD